MNGTARPPDADVDWRQATRIIRTVYPPADLFDDIADPADREAIASAEAKTNPRVRARNGVAAVVPDERRLRGAGAGLVMGAFAHASPARPSRFSDGRYGVWYCGDRPEVALAETVFHFELFMAATAETPAEADFRELVSGVRGRLADLRADPGSGCLLPDDYRPGQALGRLVRREGGDGILYPSVRWPKGLAAALFWPDRVVPPITQARHLRYRWNGTRCDRIFVHGGDRWLAWPDAFA